VAHEYGIENRVLIKSKLVLVEHGDPLFRPLADLAPVRLKLTGQDLQKGGFAGAVGAYQPVTVAGDKLDIDVLENHFLAIGESNIGCSYHYGFLIVKKNTTGATPVASGIQVFRVGKSGALSV